MKTKHRKKPKFQRLMALEMIKRLFEQAKLRFNKDPQLSHRYVELARKIGMRYKVGIPKEFKVRFCRHCYRYLVPSKNCRVRLQRGKIVYYCLSCKRYKRFPYIKEQKERRKGH